MSGRFALNLNGLPRQPTAEGFDVRCFQSRAVKGLETLELKGRASAIAMAMAEQMPTDFGELAPLLVRSFGPPLGATEGNGLAPFFYLPHAHLIATSGVSSFDSGMAANYEITMRFTAEFSVRPFLVEHRSKCLELLKRWAKDENPHVRRLVSEGTRPRLPWAMRLPEFQADPQLSLPLLESPEGRPRVVRPAVGRQPFGRHRQRPPGNGLGRVRSVAGRGEAVRRSDTGRRPLVDRATRLEAPGQEKKSQGEQTAGARRCDQEEERAEAVT
jgi:hypothetical protein